MRRLLTRAFHFDILRPYVKVYNDAARVLVSQWRGTPEGEAFDACHSISLFTLDVMLRCSCSFESNCQVSKYA
jgi:cytochrome P450